MTTEATDSLAGGIAQALDEAHDNLCGFDAEQMSDAVLLVVAEELRAAQEAAWNLGQCAGWDEAQERWYRTGLVGDGWKDATSANPYRVSLPCTQDDRTEG